jgi:hypothetical protein
MANNINWGNGVNNNIGWGQGSTNNSISWGKSYSVSSAGETLLIKPATPLTVDSISYKADSTTITSDKTLI